MKAKISEIFESIQGEGLYQGRKQVFIRFFGCNLSCDFCDTQIDYYRELSVDEIINEISCYRDYQSISLTGGEPLLQVGPLQGLAKRLKSENKTVYLETNGTLTDNLAQVIDNVDVIAMDFKLPSSTYGKKLWSQHKDFLNIAAKKEVFIKAVIGKATMIEDILRTIRIIRQVKPDLPLVLQPQNPFEDLLRYKMMNFEEICRRKKVNVSVRRQLHKELGVR